MDTNTQLAALETMLEDALTLIRSMRTPVPERAPVATRPAVPTAQVVRDGVYGTRGGVARS